MCGIFGFNWNDQKLAQQLCPLLKHRGPDQNGVWADNKVTLGHTRLSIIDLSERGRQPMTNKDQTLIIVFNGEIFNYQQLKEQLTEYSFSSTSDTEVIIYAYDKWGQDCVKKLDGQFAFCLYDVKKKQLFLARDRLGINPLYYYNSTEKLIFGSELKAVAGAGVPKKINEFALHHYLAYGYTPHAQSIFENVYKLEPAHYLIFDLENKKISTTRYWDINLTSEITDEAEAITLLRKELDSAVKERLIADVPVGAFLSGGLDSSAIVAFASKYKPHIKTFSIAFENTFDESRHAKKVAKHFGTEHHTISFNSHDVKKLIPKMPYHYDEPFADPSMIPQYLVCKVARKYVTVSLSGDGGDELFGGYTAHQHYKYLQIQNYYPHIFNEIIFFVLKHLNFRILEKPRAYFEIGCLPTKLKYARLMSYMTQEEFKKLTGANPEELYANYSSSYNDNYLQHAINIDLNRYLPDDILTKVDRASLANSLESRPPLLDHTLVELACKISPALKIKGKVSKYIFKKALEGVLPEFVINRKKQGFVFPLASYLQHELRPLVFKYVFRYKKHSYFNPEFLQKLEQEYENWSKDYSRLIWALMMFNLWWEKWM